MAKQSFNPSEILGVAEIQLAINKTAGDDESAVGTLQERVVEAAELAQRIADDREQELLPWMRTAIAQTAATSLDPADSAQAVYNALSEWLGDFDKIPPDLRLSWEPKKKQSKASKPKKKAATPVVPEISEERGVEIAQSQNQMAVVNQAVMDSAEVYKALGRIEGIDFLRRVGDVAIAQTFVSLRNNKKYKGIPFKDAQGNLRHVADFQEFCEVFFGKSYRRCHELAQNLNLLGSDLYESAERIGFRAKDYRALKALPAEEQEVVKQALDSESKDEVLAILEDMAARHQAEKETAQKEKEDMAADLEARSKLLQTKANKLDEISLELERLKSLPPAKNMELKLAREQEAVETLDGAHIRFLAETNTFFQSVATLLAAEDVSAHTKEYAVLTVRKCCMEWDQFLVGHGIAIDFQDIVLPEWTRDAAKTDLEKGNTAEPSGAHEAW